LWGRRRPPAPSNDTALVGRWTPSRAADLTRSRRQLHAEVDGADRGSVDDGAIERLLLIFEEIGSNAVRHGRGPVEITVHTTDHYWLLQVTDAAVEAPPAPAIDRDPGQGGLGLYLVARICGAHGWCTDGDRKTLWARIDYTVAEAPADVVEAVPKPAWASPGTSRHGDHDPDGR
jgi:hypothetical protein